MLDALDVTSDERKALGAAIGDMIRFGRRLLDKGLVIGSAGNISVRFGDLVIITPSSVEYDSISEGQMCVMSKEGRRLAGTGRPSSEYALHRMIYETSPAKAVIHTHSPSAVAVSALCEELPAIHYSILRLGGTTVRVARYQTFGSDALARSASQALKGRVAALLQNHGAVAYGSTLDEAYARAELVEWLSDVWLRSRQAGAPRILSERELEAVAEQARQRRYNGAGQ